MKIKTPQLGTNDNSATVVELNFKNEEKVKSGEIICSLETTKSIFDIEAQSEGFISFVVKTGDEVSVSDCIAIICDNLNQLKQEVENFFSSQKTNSQNIKATKKAISLAKELSIDLNKIKTNDIVREKDVREFAEVNATNDKTDINVNTNKDENIKEVVNLIGSKKIGKDLMLLSKETIPHSYIERATIVDNWILKANEKLKNDDVYITILSLAIYGLSKSLKEYEIFNSFRRDNQIFIYDKINIGVVITNDNQISIPIIKEVDKLTPEEIVASLMEMRKSLVKRKLNTKNLMGGTFTVSALDHTSVTRFVPIIHPGQAAVLAIPKIENKILLDNNGKTVLNKIINLGISFDHSFLDANQAATLLDALVEEIEGYCT
jgi:pyruvate/2-oxoglutarate dehydrogenase complex dihydrolipoamide acyltransferase (E2) component